MIDFVANFRKYHKKIARYLIERKEYYDKSETKRLFLNKTRTMDSSWNMEPPNQRRSKRGASSNMLVGITHPLVKQQILIRRSIFTQNYRANPIMSFKPIGSTPVENAQNIQDLVEANNEATRFRQNVLIPGINMMCRWGVSVIYTEYCEEQVIGKRTVSDPLLGSRQVRGVVKHTKNALSYVIDARNYFQNPDIVDSDSSDYRGDTVRMTLASLIARVKKNPELYIKENVEKVIKRVKDEHFVKEKEYIDPQNRQTARDYGKIYINDVVKGQAQVLLEGNEDDNTYYYYEMVGDIIIRFEDNPYDLNMNQYTVWLCEPTYEQFWGTTPAEYSLQNEYALNLLGGLGLENAIEAMKKYLFYNKNAINPNVFNRTAHGGKIPVDVSKDIALNNIVYQYQPQDTALPAIEQAYRRLMENDQRVTTTPDLNRPAYAGGASNKTAYAADLMAGVGNQLDADILEKFSHCLSRTGEKQALIISQFLGNFGPISIRPPSGEERIVTKAQIMGNHIVYIDTALQKTNQGEIQRYQNMVTWLLNLASAGIPLPMNFEPLVRQVLKMGKVPSVDEVLPQQQQMPQQQQQVPQQEPQQAEVAV